jgi:hypothetical protein
MKPLAPVRVSCVKSCSSRHAQQDTVVILKIEMTITMARKLAPGLLIKIGTNDFVNTAC